MPATATIEPGFVARLRDAAEMLGPLERIAGAMFFVKDASYRSIAMSDAEALFIRSREAARPRCGRRMRTTGPRPHGSADGRVLARN